MTTALLVITDGRVSCLEQTLESVEEALFVDELRPRVLINDSLDKEFAGWLSGRHGRRYDIHHVAIGRHGKQGFGGAIQAGWDAVRPARPDYVFHLEDDFTFNEPVNLPALQGILDNNQRLAQIALVRQPWNAEEHAAGGIVACHPDDYTEWHDEHDNYWLEHHRCFTTNPCLYRGDLLDKGWPQVPHSEGIFTHQLLAEEYSFAYWGARSDPPAVHHIGDQRVGTGY